MNYATALALPSWTAEIQGYSQQVIRYTPIFLKAFSKTIAPQLLTIFKDLSHYYFECGRGAGAWAMIAAGITHNPIQAAVRSAHTELTSPDAITTYRRLQHITRETAIDALVIGLCGVVAVAQGVEAAHKIYGLAKRVYRWVDGRLNPLPARNDSFGKAFAVADEKAITAIIEEVRYERYFLSQFDQLDSDILAINAEEIDEAIAQVKANQLKCDRAALVLQMECDRSAQEAFAYVVDQAVAFAKAETVQVVAAPVIVEDHPATVLKAPTAPATAETELVGSLDVPGATGKRTSRAKASTSKAGMKPKGTRAKAKV
jgi:hypothetical protein